MIDIGRYIIASPYLLAPLAGYTDLVFREICMRAGAGAGVTELLSATALAMGQKKTIAMLAFYQGEQPRWAQLFAGSSAILAAGARVAAANGAQVIDINMGCPVRKVVSHGAGAAWHKRPDEAAAAVATVIAAIGPEIPVTVKIRSGWDAGSINAPELAARLAEAGAAAITVHGRTRTQGYGGSADWEVIGRCVEAVGGACPLIGNGDVRCPADARALMEGHGCDAVMVGRAAMGNPWIFTNLREGRELPVTPAERATTAIEHLRGLVSHMGDERRAVRLFRAQSMCYLKGFPGAVAARRQVAQVATVADMEREFSLLLLQ